jgi:hypothetical protein
MDNKRQSLHFFPSVVSSTSRPKGCAKVAAASRAMEKVKGKCSFGLAILVLGGVWAVAMMDFGSRRKVADGRGEGSVLAGMSEEEGKLGESKCSVLVVDAHLQVNLRMKE